MAWNYQRQERQYQLMPEGDYRIRIREVEKVVSKKGRDMLAFQFDVSGRNEILYHYLVFLEEKPEITNRQLTQFFDSFKDIPDGDFNLTHWIGKVGACRVKHETSDYNGGTTQARVHYFLDATKQAALPAWVEPTGFNGSVDSNGFMNIPDDATKQAALPAWVEPTGFNGSVDSNGFMNIPDDAADEIPLF